MTNSIAACTAELEPTGFFALRTACLPVQVLLEWADDPEAAPGEIRQRLAAIVCRPEVREALCLATPSTCAAVQTWLERGQPDDPKLLRTLVKYLHRMAGRPTPFGVFAGCSVGTIDERHAGTDLEIQGAAAYRRSSRIDYEYLAALAVHLSARDDVRRRSTYRPNSSLYHLGGRWRYVHVSMVQGERRDRLVVLERDDVLSAMIARASSGARFDQLVACVLAERAGGPLTANEATALIDRLIEEQVLITDLMPLVTGGEALAETVAQLRSIGVPALDDVTDRLSETADALAAIDPAPLGLDTQRYDAIRERLIGLGPEADPSRLLQVDMIKPAPRARCGAALVAAVRDAVALLRRITPEPVDRWQRFREAFRARYEYREVPLMEALDEESGIGADWWRTGSAQDLPLLHGLPLTPPPASPAASWTWTAKDAFLFSRVDAVRRAGGNILDLSDDDVACLASPRPTTLPDALAAVVVVGQGETRHDDDVDVFVQQVFGPSGVNMMARFCHADAALRQWVARHIAEEEALRPDAVFAEIVHLPDGRTGNVLARPVLRSFEIAYMGRSGAGDDHRIPVSDLVISIRGERVVLRSRRLGREVIPRLTTMHNFSRLPGVYRFLGALQQQRLLGWGWGALATLDVLPRVTRGRIVLARARWRLDRRLAAILAEDTPDAARVRLRRWRESHGLPRFVTVPDGESELVVDFHNALSVDAFLHIAKDRSEVTLIEMFPQPERLAAYGPEGRFAHEVVIPFVARDTAPPARPAAAVVKDTPVRARRWAAPGSEWLFLKWYAGMSTLDDLLGDTVPALVARQMERAAIDRWFFIRYGDPDWHLRLRFRGDPGRLRSETLADSTAAVEALLRDARVWKVQLDTYEREIERYGGDCVIDLAEEVFWRDSEAAVRVLRLLSGPDRGQQRWRVCARAWDLLLTDLGFSLSAKRALVKASRERLVRQNGYGKPLHRALGDKFRAERKDLEALFDPAQQQSHPLAGVLAVLDRRSRDLAPVMHALRQHDRHGTLSISLAALAANHLHMTANRLLGSSHREQELVLFDVLDRLYESQQARARGRGPAHHAARPVRVRELSTRLR